MCPMVRAVDLRVQIPWVGTSALLFMKARGRMWEALGKLSDLSSAPVSSSAQWGPGSPLS